MGGEGGSGSGSGSSSAESKASREDSPGAEAADGEDGDGDSPSPREDDVLSTLSVLREVRQRSEVRAGRHPENVCLQNNGIIFSQRKFLLPKNDFLCLRKWDTTC